ncbi:hypothetical protein QJS10_CPA03g01474 [Acorus calamus]|uniref:Uncharacterized protein n=1 Tax=Acorus calamus TaxID=4465 RepID=A0AAV9F2F1_ACOCL|nr:hypothetical protein QJS10_CPA03g01474 [Acorus calamus]
MASNLEEVKLLVDKDRNQVVFAESNKDLVDFLFSFLTLPLGRIVTLLGKGHLDGCIDNIYESVENLQECHFQSKACRELLLRPRSASDDQCRSLAIQIGQPEIHYKYFVLDLLKYALVSKAPLSKAFLPGGGSSGEEEKSKIKVNLSLKEDFVELLFGFLTLPLGSIVKLFSGQSSIGCLDNLYKSAQVFSNGDNVKFNTPYTNKLLSPKIPEHFGCYCNLLGVGESEDHYYQDMANNLKVKLLVDKDTNQVVLAESNKDLVDLLFSFLTLPLGRVVSLLGKGHLDGCINNIYGSVDNLEERHVHVKACREMLLHPRSASEVQCMESLAIQIGQPEIHYKYFLCPSSCEGYGGGYYYPYISLVGNTQSNRCDKVMDKEVLDLLKYALISKDPISKVFLTGGGSSGEDVRSKIKCESNSQECGKVNQNIIIIKLVRKLNGKVLFAEVEEDFVELLFGFLTLSLGFIVKLFGGQSSIGCLNLYKSAQVISNGDYVRFKGPYTDTLLSPKIPKHFGSSWNLFGVEESSVSYVDFPGKYATF